MIDPEYTHESMSPDGEPYPLGPGAQLVQTPPTDEALAKSPLVKVRVCDWTQINHDGKVYRGGETFAAPRVLVDAWLRAGWAEEIGPARRPGSRRR